MRNLTQDSDRGACTSDAILDALQTLRKRCRRLCRVPFTTSISPSLAMRGTNAIFFHMMRQLQAWCGYRCKCVSSPPNSHRRSAQSTRKPQCTAATSSRSQHYHQAAFLERHRQTPFQASSPLTSLRLQSSPLRPPPFSIRDQRPQPCVTRMDTIYTRSRRPIVRSVHRPRSIQHLALQVKRRLFFTPSTRDG